MINIIINEDGTVVGDAYEDISVTLDISSRCIKTYLPKLTILEDPSIVYGYNLKSGFGDEVLFPNESGYCEIPERYIVNNAVLEFSFFIQNQDEEILFRSSIFNLTLILSKDYRRPPSIRKSSDAQNFIVVQTIAQRNSIPENKLVNGKIVKVENIGNGKSRYYSYNERFKTWDREDFVDDIIETSEMKDFVSETANDVIDKRAEDNTLILSIPDEAIENLFNFEN